MPIIFSIFAAFNQYLWHFMIAKNNPFNIRYSRKNNWFGQIGRRRGFAEFNTFDNGMRAGLKILVNYVRFGHNTIDDIISRFAPPCENDTAAYISFVKQSPFLKKNCKDGIVSTYLDVCFIAQRILIYESSTKLEFSEISSCMEHNVLPFGKVINDRICCVTI